MKTPKLNSIHPRTFFLPEIMYMSDYHTFSETGGGGGCQGSRLDVSYMQFSEITHRSFMYLQNVLESRPRPN